ncbi:MAG: hypothetical protein IJB35_02555 [Oscillospiraceae bacterium]|nr:hypothetical protein [Oscillospiraceae bacterium]
MKEQENKNLVTVCDVQFRSGSKVYYFDPGLLTVHTGDEVILDTAHGPEFAQCARGNHTVTQREIIAPLRSVVRLATAQDKKIHEENLVHEKYAYDLCLKKIEELGLEMQLVSTEYAFDGSKILFFFTADGRVDFRELVKALASILHTRIELRQIGVRDKAKMVGGLGICGRPFCCGEFLEDFQPVSIKMAKTQNLSLNPAKISGTCGRLMCCLNYEQEAYEDLLRTSPKAESFVDTPDGRGTVTNVNLLRQSVNVRLEKQPDTIVCHKNCDICVLRNGKAKKTDEPIPEDLAPISGGKPKKEEESTGFSTYLEPVVLRAEAKQEPAAEVRGEKSGRNRSRHRTGRQPAPAGKGEKKEAAVKIPEQKPDKKQEQKAGKKQEQKATGKQGKKPDKKPEQKPAGKQAASPATETSPEEKKPKSNKKRRYYKHYKSNKKPQA